MQDDAIVIGFADYRAPAQRLAKAAGIGYAEALIHRFPDGESRIRLPGKIPETVVLCRTLNAPNAKLVELLLTAATARELGAARVVLVAPYLCYMRQDKAFAAGEAVSQNIIGKLLSEWFESLITVDAHLHRVKNLSDIVPGIPATNLSACIPISNFIASQPGQPVLIGPDSESEQWVSSLASANDLEYLIGDKTRFGDHEISVSLPEANIEGRNVVILDDIASTGRTLEETVRCLQSYKPASISILVTHGLFLEGTEKRLRAAGTEHIWSTDSVIHKTNAVHLDTLFSEALATMAQT